MTRILRMALAVSLIAAAPLANAQTAATHADDSKPAAADTPASGTPANEAPASETPAAQAPAQPAPQQPAPQQLQRPQEVVVASHGDWDIVCAPGGSPCVMLQKGENAQGQNVMEVRIRRIKPQQTQQGTVEGAIQVAVPLGVLLPAGINIQIDSSKPIRAGYSICDRSGCLLQQPMPNRMIAAMKKGAKAVFTIVAPPKREIPVEISLKGFTAAYNALPH